MSDNGNGQPPGNGNNSGAFFGKAAGHALTALGHALFGGGDDEEQEGNPPPGGAFGAHPRGGGSAPKKPCCTAKRGAVSPVRLKRGRR